MWKPAAIRTLVSGVLVSGIATAALAPPVLAAPPKAKASPAEAEAEAIRLRAVEHFKAKQYDAAAKAFMQAYARVPTPALVYNAARAYEEAGKTGDAAALFRLYITISDDADGIVEARERLKRLEKSSTPAASEPPATKTSEAGPSAPRVEVGARTEVTTGDSLEGWKWPATGLAVALLAGGGTLMVLGAGASEDANGMKIGSDADIADYESRYERASTQWWTGAGLLAGGVAAGAFAAWLHVRPGRVALVPSVQGASLAVKF